MEKPDIKELKKAIKILEHNSEEKRRRSIKKNNIINGSMLFLLSFSATLTLVIGNWRTSIFVFSTGIWIALVWLQENHIANLKYLLDMMIGLRDLENKEIEKADKETQHGSTNATSNRKK